LQTWSLLLQPAFFERVSAWATPLAIRRLKAMQLAQPVRPPVQLFCACDVFLVKAIQRAKVIEP
jgi:hypothetical protein